MDKITKRIDELEKHLKPGGDDIEIITIDWDQSDNITSTRETVSLAEFKKRYPGREPGGVVVNWE